MDFPISPQLWHLTRCRRSLPSALVPEEYGFWDGREWTVIVSMRVGRQFSNCSFSSMRGRWSQPVRTTRCISGTYDSDVRLSYTLSNSTESGEYSY
ncbi:unnamed protein product [Leuciscus chuanchicus]